MFAHLSKCRKNAEGFTWSLLITPTPCTQGCFNAVQYMSKNEAKAAAKAAGAKAWNY